MPLNLLAGSLREQEDLGGHFSHRVPFLGLRKHSSNRGQYGGSVPGREVEKGERSEEGRARLT